jgi:hypothetical protein
MKYLALLGTRAFLPAMATKHGLGGQAGLASGVIVLLLLLVAPVRAAQTGPGYALRFDGNSGYVKIPGFLQNAPSTEITVEFWQNVSDIRPQATFCQTPPAPGFPAPGSTLSAFVPFSDGMVYWDFGNISAGGRLSYQPQGAIINTWQHFAMVASSSGGYMAIYRNGVREAFKTGMTPLVHTNLDLNLSGVPAGLPFGGLLDEFRIWNVARTGDQILMNMNHSLTGNEPGLVAYWRFNEGNGNLTQDATGGAANAGLLSASVTWVHSTAPFVPDVSTLAASGAAAGGMIFNARVNPDSLPTTAWFQWGTNSNFGNTTQPINIGNNSTPFFLRSPVTGLSQGAKYYFQPVASNLGGIEYGVIESLVVPPGNSVTNSAVTNLLDNGTYSLRDIISTSAPNARIDIPTNLFGVIRLTTGPLPTGTNLTIVGHCNVIIDGNGGRAFLPVTNSLTLTDLTISNCAAGGGGAILVGSFGTFAASNCNFVANSALGGGGAITVNDLATLVLNNCTLSGNQATSGGAIDNYGEATLNSCTVASNTASSTGGGLLLESTAFSSLAVNNCTIAGNSAASGGGGIEDDEGSLSMQNSIVADNVIGGGSGPDVRNSVPGFASSGYNLIGRDDASSGWRHNGLSDDDLRGNSGSPLNPLLARLNDFCGCTHTMELLPGSPAIDTGSSGGFSIDQRALPRPQNVLGGGSPPGDYSDIGAFEVQTTELLAPPVLTILPAGANVILLWDAKAKAYTLEHSLSLHPTTWLVVPQVPALTNGDTQLTVTRTASASTDFYRLRAP